MVAFINLTKGEDLNPTVIQNCFRMRLPTELITLELQLNINEQDKGTIAQTNSPLKYYHLYNKEETCKIYIYIYIYYDVLLLKNLVRLLLCRIEGPPKNAGKDRPTVCGTMVLSNYSV